MPDHVTGALKCRPFQAVYRMLLSRMLPWSAVQCACHEGRTAQGSTCLDAQGGLCGLDEADRGPGDRERPSRSFGPRFADQERLGIGSEPDDDDDDDDHFVKFGRKDAASSPGKKLLLDLF